LLHTLSNNRSFLILCQNFILNLAFVLYPKLTTMGVDREAWIFIHGTNVVDRGLIVVFFGLFC